jgi:hypothetical protein
MFWSPRENVPHFCVFCPKLGYFAGFSLNIINFAGRISEICPKLGYFAGFSLNIINFAGRISEASKGEARGAQRPDFAC